MFASFLPATRWHHFSNAFLKGCYLFFSLSEKQLWQTLWWEGQLEKGKEQRQRVWHCPTPGMATALPLLPKNVNLMDTASLLLQILLRAVQKPAVTKALQRKQDCNPNCIGHRTAITTKLIHSRMYTTARDNKAHFTSSPCN